MNESTAMGHSREGLSSEKINHFLKVFRGHTRSADAYLDSFSHFNLRKLRLMTNKNIHNILLDVDACIAPPYDDILEENLLHIKGLLEEKVGIGIYSNCQGMKRLWPLYDLGLDSYEGIHPKPNKVGFLEACNKFGFDPSSTWMIGDNPNTDGGAIGVLEGMAFVKPIPENLKALSWKKRIIAPFQRLFRDIAIARTVSGNNELITSKRLEDFYNYNFNRTA